MAAAAEFAAKVFANEVLLTNLGSLPFGRQFGPVTLKAMFGPAVLTGFEDRQTIGVATVNGALCLLHASHTPLEGLLERTRGVLAMACAGVCEAVVATLAAVLPLRGSIQKYLRLTHEENAAAGPYATIPELKRA